MSETLPRRLALLLSLRRVACGCTGERPCVECSARALDRRARRETGHARQIASAPDDWRGAQLDVVEDFARALGVEPAWLAYGAGPAFAAHPSVDPVLAPDRAAELLRASLGAPAAPLPAAAPPPPRRRPQRLPPLRRVRKPRVRNGSVTVVEAAA